MQPARIKLDRLKGWKLPPNSASVARPTKWGCPLRNIGGRIYLAEPSGRKPCRDWAYLCPGDKAKALMIFRHIVSGKSEELGLNAETYSRLIDQIKRFSAMDWREIRGKNLGCSCLVGSACHADVLLELANG